MILSFLRAFSTSRPNLAAGNMPLRHQLAILQRSVKRPKVGNHASRPIELSHLVGAEADDEPVTRSPSSIWRALPAGPMK